jgi:predicted PurR-regulated permease PerM
VESARIQPGAVAKVVAIGIAVIAAALLLAIIILHTRTTIRWVFAAIFLALAMSPAVDRVESLRVRGRKIFPRWLAILVVYLVLFAFFTFLILQIVPPVIREFQQLGSLVPGYVRDFKHWANDNQQFQDLNQKYNITATLSQQASTLPSKLGDAAGEVQTITVSILGHLLAAITILALTFFLVLDGRQQRDNFLGHLSPDNAERLGRITDRIAGVVKAYVSINLLLAIAAGVFTWLVLELLNVDLAVTLGVTVGFLDLIPLIGFTVGGFFVAIIAAIAGFPGKLIIWLIFFLTYQQLQDRVIQPLLYHNAVRIHPAVAIVAILVGAQLAGILGALLAIPTAASIGVLIDEWLRYRRESAGGAADPVTAPEPSAAD